MRLSIGSSLSGPARGEGIRNIDRELLHQAENFRRLAALAWSEETIYPKSVYIPGSPNGQCGVTNFGFGLWACWKGLARLEQLFFEEGELITADGSPVGDDHTWLRIDGVDDGLVHIDLSMRFDLAGDQFPAIDVSEVIQYDDYFYPDPHIRERNRIYVPAKVTCFSDYDMSRFAGRLGRFMQNVCAAAGLALPVDGFCVTDPC